MLPNFSLLCSTPLADEEYHQGCPKRWRETRVERERKRAKEDSKQKQKGDDKELNLLIWYPFMLECCVVRFPPQGWMCDCSLQARQMCLFTNMPAVIFMTYFCAMVNNKTALFHARTKALFPLRLVGSFVSSFVLVSLQPWLFYNNACLLLAAGVRIYEVTDTHLHAKSTTIDGMYSIGV